MNKITQPLATIIFNKKAGNLLKFISDLISNTAATHEQSLGKKEHGVAQSVLTHQWGVGRTNAQGRKDPGRHRAS